MKVGPRNAMVIAVCSLAVVADRERGELRASFGSSVARRAARHGAARGRGRLPRARRRCREPDRRRARNGRVPPTRAARPHAARARQVSRMRIELTVNGERREAEVWAGESLLTTLRDRLELPGSKNACEQGECGSCSVLLDGELVCSCLVLAAQADGHDVVTVEGLGGDGRSPPGAGGVRRHRRGAVRLLHAGLRRRGGRSPAPSLRSRRTTRSARRSPGTSAAAPGTRRSSTPFTWRPSDEHGRLARFVAGTRRRARGAPTPSRRSRASSPTRAISHAAGMLWGHTVRSPHAHARVVAIDTTEARTMPGVHAVLTHEDVPGAKTYGLEFADQPVLAIDRVRYFGEAVAIVAAEEPEQARRAAAAVRVEYEPLEPVTDPERATEMEPLHPDRPTMGHGYRDDPRPNVVRSMVIRRGDPDADGRRQRRGRLRRRPAGPGVPRPRVRASRSRTARAASTSTSRRSGSTSTATRSRPCLDLEPEQVRIHLAGVGGAFGGREDLSMQIHAAMLALRTGRPGEDRLQPRGVVRRPHPSPPGADLGRASGDARGPARRGADADPRRRRRVRVELDRGHLERVLVRRRPVRGRQRRDRRPRRLHEQPAVRCDARVRRGADLLRGRGADGQARRRARHRPDRAAAPERARAGRHARDRAGRDGLAADARGHPARRGASAPRAGGAPARGDPAPRRRGEHDARRGRAPRRRLRGRLQEHLLLGGLRRLLHRARRARRGRLGGGALRGRRGGPGRERRDPAGGAARARNRRRDPRVRIHGSTSDRRARRRPRA